jgi:hypothetical protein
MKSLLRPLVTICVASSVSLLGVAPTPAYAGVDVQVHIGLPVAPPLVVVEPGISVVEDWGEEVFFVSPYYWVRRGDLWYRARSPRAAFRVAPRRAVPVALVRMPPGQYVKYTKAKHAHRHDGRPDHDRGHDHDGRHKHGRGHDRDGGHDRGHGRDGHKGGHGKH